jgi:hypothetical protein
LRALATKSASVVKIPSGALVAGGALALALHFAGRRCALARHTSAVYWPGGNAAVEEVLFHPAAFDRIVVWGAPDAVESVNRRAKGVKVLSFHPRYGVSMIGREALGSGRLGDTVRAGVADALVWNQKACIASLVHYVETDLEGARAYAKALAVELGAWQRTYPNPLLDPTIAKLRRARRGPWLAAEWFPVGNALVPEAAVVVAEGDVSLSEHPMSRVIVVRPVAHLEDAVQRLTKVVSQVGVAPEPRRQALRTSIAARGVSAVLPLGEADTTFAGMPHDNLRPLSELVSWAVG